MDDTKTQSVCGPAENVVSSDHVKTLERYEDMSNEDLIECCKAHDAHHQEHHQREEDLLAENKRLREEIDQWREQSGKQADQIRRLQDALEEMRDQHLPEFYANVEDRGVGIGEFDWLFDHIDKALTETSEETQ